MGKIKNLIWGIIFLLVSYINISAQSIGGYFSLGPGFNTRELNSWINNYQLGTNFGLEYNAETLIWRLSFNAETSEGRTDNQIIIDGEIWPSDMQVNFMAVQFSIGYPIRINNYSFIFFGGISGSWLNVPNDDKQKFTQVGNSNTSTGLAFGPMITVSSRYKFWRDVFSSFSAFIDLGLIYPMFDIFIDSKLSGIHYNFKLGICLELFPKG
jgi:hypothetical protein